MRQGIRFVESNTFLGKGCECGVGVGHRKVGVLHPNLNEPVKNLAGHNIGFWKRAVALADIVAALAGRGKSRRDEGRCNSTVRDFCQGQDW